MRGRGAIVVAALVLAARQSPALADVDVAVVNAVPGDAGKQAIDQLRATLDQVAEQAALSTELRNALEDAVGPDDASNAAQAAATRKAAFDAYASFKYKQALARIREAEALLVAGRINTAAMTELGELALLRAQVRLQSGEVDEAEADFRFASRSLARRSLDPGLYSPAEIKAFEAAVAKPAGEATLELSFDGLIEIDGKPWSAPTTIAAGIHLIVFSRAGHARSARIVDLDAGTNSFAVALSVLPTVPRIISLRRALADGHAGTALADIAEATTAARLLVFVRTQTGIGVKLYNSTSGAISEIAPATADGVRGLLAAPNLDPSVVVKDPDGEPPRVTNERSWLRRNRTPLLVTGGVTVVVAAVVAGVLLSRDGDSAGAVFDRFCGFGVPCTD